MKDQFLCLLFLIFVTFSFSIAEDSTKVDTQQAQPAGPQLMADPDSTTPSKSLLPDPSSSAESEPTNKNNFNWFDDAIKLGAFLVALSGLIFGIYRYYRKRLPLTRRQAEKRYRDVLKEGLGTIRILGSPEIENLPVSLLDTFVSLNISYTWRSEERIQSLRDAVYPGDQAGKEESGYVDNQDWSPEAVIERAFRFCQLLLIIGDPGSGKTTLLKYYAIRCLNGEHSNFGFRNSVLPIYFPLRELELLDDRPASLPKNLMRWAEKWVLGIDTGIFDDWLHNRDTLILLDGLDEISDIRQRQRVCEWIENTVNGVPRARFVVTSRWTGYSKMDGIEIGCKHMRADVRDFSAEQQSEFLEKWFQAVYFQELSDDDSPIKAARQRQKQLALQRSGEIIDFLNKPKNKSVRELAAVPLLLQIMAIIWKDREFLPHSRATLYNAALKYLLDFRDTRRGIYPLLPADEALRVLSPVSLWIQEKLQIEEVPKEKMHAKMQEHLKMMTNPPEAEAFCNNLCMRAGILVDLGGVSYLFRHKSFREYLAALQLIREYHERMAVLVENFGEDWWEETLRFFINEADGKVFDAFMNAFFRSEISKNLDANQQGLLEILIQEAPQKKIDALVKCLNDRRLNDQKKRYIIDSLKTIGTEAAMDALKSYSDSPDAAQTVIKHARDSVIESRFADQELLEKEQAEVAQTIFRNRFENNAEYILISGGEYKYSVTGRNKTITDLYFAKYPVTNKRYRRFITYLEGQDNELKQILPNSLFNDKLLAFAVSIEEFTEYLGNEPGRWAQKFRSHMDNDKRFGGDDQPVVFISWFAARAYCFWLSLLELKGIENQANIDIEQASCRYRLPKEVEWEWAAAGREVDGELREYPWPKEKGEPSKNLANYERMIGVTTPVIRYPEGATPEGLMDMAGNVLEWMNSWFDQTKESRSVRGGSWHDYGYLLRCSARNPYYPHSWNGGIGFRVVRARPQ
jgi:formylglycine-generating enzyme required for sulfatase activity